MFIRKLLRNEIQIKVIALLEIVNVRLIRHDNVKNGVIIVIQHDNDVVMEKRGYMWEYRRDGNRSCSNPTGMEYVHTGTPQNLAENKKKSDTRVWKFFSPAFLSDCKETTLAGELCNKTRRQSMDPKVAVDLRQSTDRKDLCRGPK